MELSRFLAQPNPNPARFSGSAQIKKRIRINEETKAEPLNMDGSQMKYGNVAKESFTDKPRSHDNIAKVTGTPISLSNKEKRVFNSNYEGCVVRLQPGTRDKLMLPWKDALVIKLVGENHSYGYMHVRLNQKWAPNGAW